jgi:hypothetical protein
VWVVRPSAANRRLLARYPEIFRSAFPGSSRAWVAALTTGAPPPCSVVSSGSIRRAAGLPHGAGPGMPPAAIVPRPDLWRGPARLDRPTARSP